MKPSLIDIEAVSKSYERGGERIPIFNNLSLKIEEGEFLALMGPSGSGKTTLLNLLGGIDRINSGNIVIGGERIDNFSEVQFSRWRASNVGFIFQFYNLIAVLNAAQNVELPLLLTRMSKSERKERVQVALEVVGLENRARHYPKELSGGQQQRVAIARALVSDPRLILADEPTGDLDRETADEILQILQQLSSTQNKTIVMVTHDLRAAEYSDRILHLDKGEFVDRKLAA